MKTLWTHRFKRMKENVAKKGRSKQNEKRIRLKRRLGRFFSNKTKQQNKDSMWSTGFSRLLLNLLRTSLSGSLSCLGYFHWLSLCVPLWYWPCPPGRPLEAASNEAPVPGSQSCCRIVECLQWKPPRWNQWKCGWCVGGSPERIPGSSLEKILRTPARAHLNAQSSSSKGIWEFVIVIGNMAGQSQFMIKLRMAADLINKKNVDLVLTVRDE